MRFRAAIYRSGGEAGADPGDLVFCVKDMMMKAKVKQQPLVRRVRRRLPPPTRPFTDRKKEGNRMVCRGRGDDALRLGQSADPHTACTAWNAVIGASGAATDISSLPVIPPEGWYFVRGLRTWRRGLVPRIWANQISCSLQNDGVTSPLRPFGYVLKLYRGAIVAAFDRDVSSTTGANVSKSFGHQTAHRESTNYGEAGLGELTANTRRGSHNEIWVDSSRAEIAQAYVLGGSSGVPGTLAFVRACRSAGLDVHWIAGGTDKPSCEFGPDSGYSTGVETEAHQRADGR